MCKYEKDPASIVKDTEWTQFDGQMDGQSETSKEYDDQTYRGEIASEDHIEEV